MTPPADQSCCHPDIRAFDGVRCCLSCGFCLFDEPTQTCTRGPNREDDTYAGFKDTFKYRRLNYELGLEIRLAILKQGSHEEELYCDIVHANLDDKPRFEAVSYTWADQKGKAEMSRWVNCSGGRRIRITTNCHAVLRRIRSLGSKRTLWIDMLCIDHNNVDERNHQVNLMSKIYSLADNVLVDVGEEDSASSLVFEQSTRFALNQPSSISLEVLRDFFSRRWFHRMWVLQEIAFAGHASVLCGSRCTDWQTLQAFVNRVTARVGNEGPSLIVPGAFDVKRIAIDSWQIESLPELLDAIRHRPEGQDFRTSRAITSSSPRVRSC